MTTAPGIRLLVATHLVLAGCATTSPRVPVHGRTVEVTRQAGTTAADPVKGELLAVGSDRLFVLAAEGVRVVPQDEIQQVRVKVHGLSGAKAGTWVAVGALLTAGALAAACASVDDVDNSCGRGFGLTAAVWALIGVPAALGLGKSSREIVEAHDLALLRPYARYPQGLPEGLDPARLLMNSPRLP